MGDYVQFQRVSPWTAWPVAQYQACRHGAGAVTQGSHLISKLHADRLILGFGNLKTQLQWHPSSNKTTPPYPTQTVPITGDHTFKYGLLGPFSFNPPQKRRRSLRRQEAEEERWARFTGPWDDSALTWGGKRSSKEIPEWPCAEVGGEPTKGRRLCFQTSCKSSCRPQTLDFRSIYLHKNHRWEGEGIEMGLWGFTGVSNVSENDKLGLKHHLWMI